METFPDEMLTRQGDTPIIAASKIHADDNNSHIYAGRTYADKDLKTIEPRPFAESLKTFGTLVQKQIKRFKETFPPEAESGQGDAAAIQITANSAILNDKPANSTILTDAVSSTITPVKSNKDALINKDQSEAKSITHFLNLVRMQGKRFNETFPEDLKTEQGNSSYFAAATEIGVAPSSKERNSAACSDKVSGSTVQADRHPHSVI